jgi:hypothetical protein
MKPRFEGRAAGRRPPNLLQTMTVSKVKPRMGYASRALSAGGLGFAVAFLTACGGGGHGLLSSDQASTLSNQLDQLSSAVDTGNCGAAHSAVSSLNNAIDNLPSSVNPALATNLKQGAATVGQLEVRDCHTTTTSSTTSSTPSSTTSSSSTTTTSSSTPTSTTTSTSTPTSSSSATTSGSGGNTSTSGGSGGAGLGGGGGNSGGAGAGGGNGNGQ